MVSKILEKIYYSLPLPFQNLAITFYGLHWFNRRYGGVFKRELASCLSRERFSDAEWKLYQEDKLRKILIHALKNVPYYSVLFKNHGFDEKDLENFTLERMCELPFLEKNTLRTLGTTDLVSIKRERFGLFYPSSGSTGTPTQNLYSLRMHQTYYAIFEATVLNWAGLDYKVPRGVIGGRRIIKEGIESPPYYRYNYIEKQTYLSAYHLSPSTIRNYVEGLKRNKVVYLTGYASANYFLARFIEEAKIDPPKIKAILTSADLLTTEMRDTFRRVYGCETFDSYNGVEATCLISECEYHSLHIVQDVGIIEILNENGLPCKPGETGEVISTGLLNYDQPLIRYKMGDLVKLASNQNCQCGRSLPVVEEIIGRIEDTVIGKDGREMVRFHGIFYNIPSIIEGQIIQHTLNEFEVKVVSDNLKKDEVQLMKQRMLSQLGEVDVLISNVSSIERNANGKFKSVISYVKRNHL
jgi:phenylacetate-CoA ligase